MFKIFGQLSLGFESAYKIYEICYFYTDKNKNNIKKEKGKLEWGRKGREGEMYHYILKTLYEIHDNLPLIKLNF